MLRETKDALRDMKDGLRETKDALRGAIDGFRDTRDEGLNAVFS